jgi:hypothetical protein
MQIVLVLLCIGLLTVVQTNAIPSSKRGDKKETMIKNKSFIGKKDDLLSQAKKIASGAVDALRSDSEKKRKLDDIGGGQLERVIKDNLGAGDNADKETEESLAPTDGNSASSIKKKKRHPYTYSIPQNAAEIASWRQIKLYIIYGMFLFIFGVIGVTYYRGKNKMLLPGKMN